MKTSCAACSHGVKRWPQASPRATRNCCNWSRACARLNPGSSSRYSQALGIQVSSFMRFITTIIFMLKLPLLARQAKRAVGASGVLGLRGRAVTPVAPEGTVFVRNELWRARAHQSINEGEGVVVTGLDG